MNLFSGIWAKVAAALAVATSAMFFILRFQSKKIDRLEDENAKIKKKSEIQAQAAIDKASITANEQEEVLRMTKEVRGDDKKITVDDLNNL